MFFLYTFFLLRFDYQAASDLIDYMISKGYNPNFDICFQKGQAGEMWTEYLGNKDATIEVKTEWQIGRAHV